MDERLKETLSAMLDNEVDELSLRRLLTQADHDALLVQWRRWHVVQAGLRGLSPDLLQLDVTAGVRAQIEGEPKSVMPTPSDAKAVVASSSSRASWPLGAIAASVFALVFGFGVGSQWEQQADPQPLAAVSTPATQDFNARPVALDGLTQDQLGQLSGYLLRHAQGANMLSGRGSLGFARAASVAYQAP